MDDEWSQNMQLKAVRRYKPNFYREQSTVNHDRFMFEGSHFSYSEKREVSSGFAEVITHMKNSEIIHITSIREATHDEQNLYTENVNNPKEPN